MLKSEKYEYGSMWTVNGFWNRVTHMSESRRMKLFVLWPLGSIGMLFLLLFNMCGGFLLTAGKKKYRQQQAEIWRHREVMEAVKSKSK